MVARKGKKAKFIYFHDNTKVSISAEIWREPNLNFKLSLKARNVLRIKVIFIYKLCNQCHLLKLVMWNIINKSSLDFILENVSIGIHPANLPSSFNVKLSDSICLNFIASGKEFLFLWFQSPIKKYICTSSNIS